MRSNGQVSLPTDTPPSNRAVVGAAASNRLGLSTLVSLGQIGVELYSTPWAPMQSFLFPNSQPSQPGVAPNAIRPRYGVAVNAYSPIAHRNPLTTQTPPPAISARGVAVPTQRPRGYAAGYVTRWPMGAPQWPSWAEAPAAGA